jgi:transposase-like protein
MGEGGGMRRYTEPERQRIVRAFESSGLSATAFCRRRGVSTVTLAHWRKRCQQPAITSAPDTMRPAPWLPVVLTDAGSLPALREGSPYLMVCGDRRLEVPPGFAPGEVRQLWQLLAEGRPALTHSRES